LARGQFLQACSEILVVCADYFIASEIAYDCFLLAPPDYVDRLESILPGQLKHQLADRGCSGGLQEPVTLLEIMAGPPQTPCGHRIREGSGGGRILQAVWNRHESIRRAHDLLAPGLPRVNEDDTRSNSRTLHARAYGLHNPHAFNARASRQFRLIAI